MSHDDDLFNFDIPSDPPSQEPVRVSPRHPEPSPEPEKTGIVPSDQSVRARRTFNWWAVLACCLLVGIAAYAFKSMLPSGGGSGVDGLHVLIVEESADRMDLPSKQRAILTSQVVREWLEENCVEEQKHPAYRLYDVDVEMDGDGEVWRDLMARKRKSLPWLYAVGGEGREYDGPLPETVEDLLEVLEAAK